MSFYPQIETCIRQRLRRVGIKCVHNGLDEMVPIPLVIGSVQSMAGDERAVESLGLPIQLWMMCRPGALLYPLECTKCGEELAYKLGPIARQQVAWYAVRDTSMVEEY